MEAWGYVIKADKLRQRLTKEDNFKARALLEKAVELEPDYTLAWALLSGTYYQDFHKGWSTSRRESWVKSNEILQKAFVLDQDHPLVNIMLGQYYFVKRDYPKATAAQEKALKLSPNNADFHMRLSSVKCYAGEYDQAVALAEKSMRLSPYPSAWFLTTLGMSYREAGRYGDAINVYQELLKRSRQGEIDPILTHLVLAVTYIYNGQENEAKLHAAEMLKRWPNISNNSIDRIQKQQARQFVDESRAIRFVDALRKALTLAGWDAKEPEK
jgi:adenylate cyclase